MKNLLTFCILLILGLSSCDCTYQYGVYVKNSTGTVLKIAYKSLSDVNGTIEEVVELQDGELKRIIWTEDIETGQGCTGSSPDYCPFVAEYVNAYLQDSIPSKIKWCDKKISFSKTDIQQGEFTIEYTFEDF